MRNAVNSGKWKKYVPSSDTSAGKMIDFSVSEIRHRVSLCRLYPVYPKRCTVKKAKLAMLVKAVSISHGNSDATVVPMLG
jgi:hypothetical protein